jgi:exocyst complex component 7
MSLSSTPPSHPAAPETHTTLKDAEVICRHAQGVDQEVFGSSGKRVVDRAHTIDGITAGKEFGRWVELLLSVAEL